MKTPENTSHSSLASYTIGFILSLILTLIPFKLVVGHSFERHNLIVAIVLFALAQLLVQLKFFLHLSFSPKARDSLYTFIFTAIILVIFVFGSIWIMHDLNYYMMDPIMDQHHSHLKE
ncbi:MAG: cytochrome o ubiquinol oxidase subunit IV [Pseudomonadota bacterium]